ncbi:MAG: (d)CMP kinase [Desulfuromonadales bacterium]|nr:(d)CMP kinase [Desulfuromonadales bacterium]
MPKQLIVAIDGPSGAGKSTLSRCVAQVLGYLNIDTGAMYRCVALAAQRQGVDPSDAQGLARLSRSVRIRFTPSATGERVLLDDVDVSDAIRTPEVSLLTPKVAAIPAVRDAMVAQQRKMGEKGGVVLEGRDIGSVVFPAAEVKIFLIATAEERGRRRFAELTAKGVQIDLARTIAEIKERDRLDITRTHSPLVKSADAIEIDTTGLTIDQVQQRILQIVQNQNRIC